MSDDRWLDIETSVESATEHFSRAGEIYRRGGLHDTTLDGYVMRMAFMHAMQSGHTSLETVLIRILEFQGEDAPTGHQWHADLIARASRATTDRPAILPPDLVKAADRTRRFRHITTHAYDRFDPDDADPAMRAAAILAEHLAPAIARFRAAIDP
jgi:hypothetical protein